MVAVQTVEIVAAAVAFVVASFAFVVAVVTLEDLRPKVQPEAPLRMAVVAASVVEVVQLEARLPIAVVVVAAVERDCFGVAMLVIPHPVVRLGDLLQEAVAVVVAIAVWKKYTRESIAEVAFAVEMVLLADSLPSAAVWRAYRE